MALALACSSSKDIDFFEPGDDASGGATGGSSGSSAGTDTGGTSTGGSAAQGGTSGDGNGGSGSEATGGNGDTGGTGAEGGTDTGGTSGTGGTDPSGGSAQGGDAGSGAAPVGGSAGMPTGGTSGAGTAGMGGTGTSGAGMGGAGTAGASMGGAGTGGAGMGGAGTGGSGGCVPTVPSTERCDGIDNNCSGAVDEGAACPDGCTGATRAGHTYVFCSFEDSSGPMNRVRTWPQALDFCTTRGLGLVAVESAEENAFVLAWIEKMGLKDQVWMGANDRDPTPLGQSREGTWVWGSGNGAVQFWQGSENGMPVMSRYEDWASGEPNNMNNEDCAVFSADHTFHWDDRICTNMYANFVCESTASIAQN